MEISEYLREVKRLKDEYSNEIPQKILHSTTIIDGKPTTPKYKVRRAWFQGVWTIVSEGVRLGYVSEETRKMQEEFEQYTADTGLKKRKTTREDIEKENAVLGKIIVDLEAKLNN